MNPPTSPARWTAEDFLKLPDDGRHLELIDGELFVTPSPTTRHQRIALELAYRIRSHLEKRPVGEIFIARYDVVLSDRDVVEPDLLYLSNERAGRVTEANLRGAPDLAVEILSPSTASRDRVAKLALYERTGVLEYWLVDPQDETVEVLRLEGGRFRRAALLSADGGEPLETPLLPGLRLDLREIFPRPEAG